MDEKGWDRTIFGWDIWSEWNGIGRYGMGRDEMEPPDKTRLMDGAKRG